MFPNFFGQSHIKNIKIYFKQKHIAFHYRKQRVTIVSYFNPMLTQLNLNITAIITQKRKSL